LETGHFEREDNYARVWADKKLIDEADMQGDPFGNEEDERRTPIAATTTFSADSKEAYKVGLEREANQSTTKSLNGKNGSSPADDSQLTTTPSSLMPNFRRLLSDHLKHIIDQTLGPKSSYKLIRDATMDPNLAEEMSRKRTNVILSSLSIS